jgi:3',5'-cyclic AMP phosphodiesterase CpdA
MIHFRVAAALVPAFMAATGLMTALPSDATGARGDVPDVSFVVAPYLQLPAPTGVTIAWESNRALPGRVEYGRTVVLGQVAEQSDETVLHKVRLSGLQPGTTYYYRVRTGSLASPVYSFRSAPRAGSQHWKIALYGDSRSNPVIHRAVAEQIARQHVDLILHTGDIVADGRVHESWRREFFEPLGELAHSVPWISTIGNHENDAPNYFSYVSLPGNERYYGIDFANVHVACLDSNGWIERGRDSPQFHWLEEHLRDKREAGWTFVVFHHPLFSAHASRPINPLRWEWAPLLLDPRSGVDAVLTGHDHFYSRSFPIGRVTETPTQGVLFLTSAGGGALLYRSKRRDYIALERSVHHFTLLEGDGDKLRVSAIDLNGNVFDRHVVRKGPTPTADFCAYEIEEVRQFLRTAIASARPFEIPADETGTVDGVLRVPTRFSVPIRGTLRWQTAKGWDMAEKERDFRIEPGEPLEIPLQARVAPGEYTRTPRLRIVFEPGRFRNRTIEVSPFKVCGPERITVPPRKTDRGTWSEAPAHRLISAATGASRGAVQLLVDANSIHISVRLGQLPESSVKTVRDDADAPECLLGGEYVRAVFRDGRHVWTFEAGARSRSACSRDGTENQERSWRCAQRANGVDMVVPRAIFAPGSQLRFTLVTRRLQGLVPVDYELCPAYIPAADPDLIPDWKPAVAERDALIIEGQASGHGSG